MYTCSYGKHGHVFTITDQATKKGVTLVMVGEDMAVFLKDLVMKANQNGDSHAEETRKPTLQERDLP